MQIQALALPRRFSDASEMDRRSAPDAATYDGVICLEDDTPLTVGLLLELLKDARRIAFSPGRCANRIDLALREAIDDRMPNPWA